MKKNALTACAAALGIASECDVNRSSLQSWMRETQLVFAVRDWIKWRNLLTPSGLVEMLDGHQFAWHYTCSSSFCQSLKPLAFMRVWNRRPHKYHKLASKVEWTECINMMSRKVFFYLLCESVDLPNNFNAQKLSNDKFLFNVFTFG